jgi:hypothetical protein
MRQSRSEFDAPPSGAAGSILSAADLSAASQSQFDNPEDLRPVWCFIATVS